jgi:hypothetical protein
MGHFCPFSSYQGSHLIFGCHIMIFMTIFIDFMTQFMTFLLETLVLGLILL